MRYKVATWCAVWDGGVLSKEILNKGRTSHLLPVTAQWMALHPRTRPDDRGAVAGFSAGGGHSGSLVSITSLVKGRPGSNRGNPAQPCSESLPRDYAECVLSTRPAAPANVSSRRPGVGEAPPTLTAQCALLCHRACLQAAALATGSSSVWLTSAHFRTALAQEARVCNHGGHSGTCPGTTVVNAVTEKASRRGDLQGPGESTRQLASPRACCAESEETSGGWLGETQSWVSGALP